MWRFATAVTLIEIGLTAFTAALFGLESDPDPYLTTDDLREFNFPFESHETERRLRFEALLGYESSTVLLHPRQSAWVSARVDQTEIDFASRRRREENWAAKGEPGATLILDDPGHLDQGYLVRQRSPSGARCELVRFRGDRMLIVKVSRRDFVEAPEEELAACERRARVLQARMLQKLRWWSAPATADRR